MIIDECGTRIFTGRGLNWTAKYRDLVAASKSLAVDSAIIDGEIIVLNDAGQLDFAALRKAITRRQHAITSLPASFRLASASRFSQAAGRCQGDLSPWSPGPA
ncbi:MULTISPECIES: hypothetical protein [Mesorhizobium]|uniref:hypothetical protein n=1 Tax=Mesorhizobium sp. TaxID=1871066 RepID=UPI001F11C811|nr:MULTISPECIES: hypothetical protein [Mesorhizobium]